MNSTAKFPLYLPGLQNESNNLVHLISADIGSKKTTLGWCKTENGKVILLKNESYQNSEYASFQSVYEKFVKDFEIPNPNRVSLAGGGPIINGKCIIANLDWDIDFNQIKSDLNIETLYLINDLEAIAYSLADVRQEDLHVIHQGNPLDRGNMVIFAPGNGLGESGLYSDGTFLRPFATEGGHTEFSPRNDMEVEFYQFLHKIYGIVTWENVISKSGLFNIYRFLRDIQRHQEPSWITERLETENFVSLITEGADKGERICTTAMDMFVEFMARESNNLVLKLKATGGLVIAGEIPHKITKFITEERFYKKFIISDKMQRLLVDIPIYLLDNDKAVLLGAAYYGAFYH